jgi:hypothetical protein
MSAVYLKVRTKYINTLLEVDAERLNVTAGRIYSRGNVTYFREIKILQHFSWQILTFLIGKNISYVSTIMFLQKLKGSDWIEVSSL